MLGWLLNLGGGLARLIKFVFQITIGFFVVGYYFYCFGNMFYCAYKGVVSESNRERFWYWSEGLGCFCFWYFCSLFTLFPFFLGENYMNNWNGISGLVYSVITTGNHLANMDAWTSDIVGSILGMILMKSFIKPMFGKGEHYK